ncbi:MAG: ferric reductase-like transmembrane domain-containing protein [Solirubrobacteraceae bacterium]|nr:ferric reductase-like transmembrane domain-containing protein [Solirubrobacteraceae bacterium]
MTGPDPLEYGWWLASRAAGIVGYVLFSVAVLAGLTMASRLASTPARKRAVLQVHEHAALAGLIAIAVHGITLLGDAWLDPGPLGVAVPFVIDYRPLAVAAGIVGAYLAAALGLSFYIRRKVGAARWRKLHQFTLLAWLLGFLHALFAGTDVSTTWMQLVLLWTAGPIVVLLGARVTAERRKRAKAAQRAHARAAAAQSPQTAQAA